MDLTLWLQLGLFIVLMGLSGFFSSSETALFSLDSVQLQQMRQDNNRRIDLIERMLSRPRRLIMVPILLLVGEITPKTLAIRNNVAFATVESGPIEFFARLIKPLRWMIRLVSEFFITLIVGKERSRGNIITGDMVRTLAYEAVGEGVLDVDEAQLIDQIFDFGNKTLEDIMTLRSDIFFLSNDTPISEAIREQRRTRHTRIPVFREHRDTIEGILRARDLLGVQFAPQSGAENEELRDLLREPYFVPETKPAADRIQYYFGG